MKKVFYEKVGRKYVPVAEYDYYFGESLPVGTHLIDVRPTSTSRQFRICPAHAPLIAAGLTAKDAMLTAMTKEDTVKPRRQPMTEQEQAAWQNLIDVWGESGRCLGSSSLDSIAQAGVDALIKEANRIMENEAVRKAYEQFILMCKLSSEQGVK